MSLNGNATKEAREENRAERKQKITELLVAFGTTNDKLDGYVAAYLDSTFSISRIEELLNEIANEDKRRNQIAQLLHGVKFKSLPDRLHGIETFVNSGLSMKDIERFAKDMSKAESGIGFNVRQGVY
jgi:hypothetical protein